ncbi:hypothetical protein JN11_04146 [Mucilaginibacter frigoritolerans]|jgi:hypothetical protein|uniref:APCDD1 domain-containing protein n=1 Tax=Mucilaginibacter frigoritolerans TaxID=652788 RepID=A0A562TQK2_9SPHI|nr:hypothetical protein [Mucilaginibacter frigoritolerans]TWI95871.1 hypothetical protein JN11_04146 [Mucilaginibacter frigoritolerans]
MTAEQTRQFIEGGEWESIAVELRPVKDRTGSGNINPFYVFRTFKFTAGNKFVCTVINYADAGGKVPLVKIVIKGHNKWQDANGIVNGAWNVDYIADEAYEIIPLHLGFSDALNKAPLNGLNKWEVGIMQDIKAKAFLAFGLAEGQIYIDYDLIYIFNELLFMGSKHVDGRAFDSPENRPTNLQIPLKRKL